MASRAVWSITTAQLVSTGIIIVLVTAALAAVGISTARDQLREEIGQRLMGVALIAAREVPAERAQLIRPGNEQTRMVRRLQSKLESVRATAGVESVFVCGPDGVLLQTGSLEIGGPCPTELGAGAARWRSATPGLLAHAPIGDVARVAVRSDGAELAVIETTEKRLYWVASGVALLGLLFAVFLARRIGQPIARVVNAADKIGGGEYSARVAVPRLAELASLARAINAMAEKVEGRDRELKALAATVAHEVRNPLNSIKLLVSLLDEELQEAGHAGQVETVAVVHAEIARLSRFLDNFLAWSRPVVAERTPQDAGAPAVAAVRMARAAAQEAGVDVTLSVADGLVAPLDAGRLEQCLLNLILNAIQYSPSGQPVEVEVSAVPDAIRYRVLDRGPGLEPEVRARLFEPFFTTRADGTGLGLCQAQSIAAAHRGTLELEPRSEGGTAAVVEVPR